MNKKSFYIDVAIVLWTILILIVLNGGSLKEYFKKKPDNFLDGIWHGILSPTFKDANLQKPIQATSGYNSGFKLGKSWTTIWIWLVTILCFLLCTEKNYGWLFCFGILLGPILGTLIGIFIGAVIFWPIYGMVYLIGSVGIWVLWLLGVVTNTI